MTDSKIMGSDDRLKKSAGDTARADRAAEDTSREGTDGTALTLEERRRQLRAEWDQNILPSPPPNPGWHYCWLSTTNRGDPIFKRLQRGYQLVKVGEIPGFSTQTDKDGEYAGYVTCNEMILSKIEEEIYQDLMTRFHFDQPNEEEEMLRNRAAGGMTDEDSTGRPLGSVEGFKDHRRAVSRPPTF